MLDKYVNLYKFNFIYNFIYLFIYIRQNSNWQF